MSIAIADTVIPVPFTDDTRSVRLQFDFENQKRRLTADEFWEFSAKNRKVRAELTQDGDGIIMALTGFESSELNSEINFQLQSWARQNGKGIVTESNGAFILPNGAVKAPDAAWTLKSRVEAFDEDAWEKFLPLCPDFVIELRSSSDNLANLKQKMQEWIDNGARLAWLIDPFAGHIHIYRPKHEPEILEKPSRVSGEEVLLGFELDLTEIW